MYKVIGTDGKEYGPVTAELVRQWISEGRVNAGTKVMAEDGIWKPLSEFPEFVIAAAAPGSALSPGPGTIQPFYGAPRTNGMAVTGLIMGIISVTFGCCCCHGFPFNLLGIVFSAIGLSQVKSEPQRYQGKGIAIAGIVLSILSVVLGIIFFALGMALSMTDVLKNIERW
jgi:hypothetical protein